MTLSDLEFRMSREQASGTGDLMLKLVTGLLMTAAAAMILVTVGVWAGLSPNDLLEMSAVV
jgi:hypothetical protein